MGAVSNADWLRSFLATQLGTAQNNMIPTGEAWPKYLDYTNPLVASLLQNSGLGNTMQWGENGIPGLTDKVNSQYNNLPSQFSSMVGNNDASKQFLSQLQDSLSAHGQDPSYALGQFKEGSGQMNDVYNTALSQFNNPYNQGQGDIGNYLLQTLGQNPMNTDNANLASYNLKQGGMTPQLSQGFNNVMSQLVNNGGQTPGVQQGMGTGQQLLGQGGQLLGSGMGMINQGQNWSNPQLQQGSNAALNLIGQGGNTPQLAGIQDFSFGNMAGGDYGQLQPGFDFANTLMNGGGLSKYTTGGGDLALQYAQGGGPSVGAGIGMNMPSFNYGGGASFTPASFTAGADVSAGPVDTGYTQSLTDIEDKAKKILDSNPLMDMQTAVSMARNDAATSIQQQNQAMMSKARARGGSPGSVVASGLQNQYMGDYADQGAQAEAKAMRDQGNVQQGLQLQKYGIGADLTKAMEQVAQARNASSSDLAGRIAAANAGIHSANAGASAQVGAANANASANVSSTNASLQARMAEAQAQLYGQLAGLNVQQRMTGLNDLVNFGGQANNQMTAGLNALPSLQQAGNARYGTDMDAYMKAAGLQSQNLATGFSGLGNLQQTQEAGQTARMNTGSNVMGTGANVMGTGAGMFNNANTLGQNNLTTGLGLIPGIQNAATSSNNTWGNILSSQQGNQMDLSKLGALLSQNNISNTNQNVQNVTNAANMNNQYKLGAGNLGNNLWGTELGGQNSGFSNNLALTNNGLNQFTALNGAQNTGVNQQQSLQALIAQIIANSNSGQGQLAQGMLGYLGGAQQGYYGTNPTGGGQQGILGGPIQKAIGTGVEGLAGWLGF